MEQFLEEAEEFKSGHLSVSTKQKVKPASHVAKAAKASDGVMSGHRTVIIEFKRQPKQATTGSAAATRHFCPMF